MVRLAHADVTLDCLRVDGWIVSSKLSQGMAQLHGGGSGHVACTAGLRRLGCIRSAVSGHAEPQVGESGI
eukprot:scaffold34821_cov84-Isochrysis_galbana.AAC.1